MKLLSVVVPCYNEEAALPYFYEAIRKVASDFAEKDVEFEFRFVNDGSKDETLKVLKALREKDQRVHYISFSRNFGKEAALYAGLTAAEGDYITLMDADLQDPPEKLYEMYSALTEEGYDCCGLRRVSRKGEPPVRSFFARQYYHIFNKISDVELVDGARDFRLMTRKGIFSWVGFNVKWLEYENVERVAGETKWNFWKLLAYSVESFVDFSVAPLHFVSVMGILTTFIAVLAIIFVIIRQLAFGGSAYGWPSLVCIILLIGGLLIFSIGIVGEYLAKMYLEIKDRPVYIVKEEE